MTRVRRSGHLRISLVAIDGSTIVGHIAFSPVSMENTTFTGLGLAPVAVLPSHQSRGIGGALIRAGIEACRNIGADFVVVLGEPRYYSRFGFQPAGPFGLANEYTEGDEFQVRELSAGCLAGLSGLVVYGEEFRGDEFRE